MDMDKYSSFLDGLIGTFTEETNQISFLCSFVYFLNQLKKSAGLEFGSFNTTELLAFDLSQNLKGGIIPHSRMHFCPESIPNLDTKQIAKSAIMTCQRDGAKIAKLSYIQRERSAQTLVG